MRGDSLLVVHSHWRVGGVRTVIGRALPAILRQSGFSSATLVSGEPAPVEWRKSLEQACSPYPVREEVLPELGYVSEMTFPPDAAVLRDCWRQLLRTVRPGAIWWHNPALGRNVPAVEALLCTVKELDVPVFFHHHDLWCDHRWKRWSEMQACGYRSTEEVARILFTAQPGVTHLTINSRDAALFHTTHGDKSRKLGNPFDPGPAVEKAEKSSAATWLRTVCGAAESTPIWLAPSRLIRRKNLLESLLQMHRLCPEAILVTGNCPTSREEQPYAEALRQIAANPAARFRLVDLNVRGAPGMAALHVGADVLVQSSLQEGFGLLFLEAASAGRPLVCRRLPNVWPDLAAQGLVFPDVYDECLVELPEAELTDERHRQQALFKIWKQGLPGPWQAFAPGNPLSHWFDGRPLPFSKLTLGAQLRILSREIAAPCGDGNSFLPTGSLQTGRIFSTSEYAGVFAGFLEGTPGKEANSDDAPCRLQDAIVRDATAPENIFPLLLDVPERKIS